MSDILKLALDREAKTMEQQDDTGDLLKALDILTDTIAKLTQAILTGQGR